MCGVMYPDRSAGRQRAECSLKGRQRCTMRLLTPENVPDYHERHQPQTLSMLGPRCIDE
jgi:hypothetical protein